MQYKGEIMAAVTIVWNYEVEQMRLNLLTICSEARGASESTLGLRSADLGFDILAQLLTDGVTWER